MIKKVFSSLKGLQGIDNLPYEVREKLYEHIRNKAVDRAEEKMLLSSKEKESFSEDDKQKLIANCESEVYEEYKSGGLKLVLAALGIGYFI
tara:strand:- start:148 stop:420 length:273 start_codon:yes stop_codon:yes gene_type:complete